MNALIKHLLIYSYAVNLLIKAILTNSNSDKNQRENCSNFVQLLSLHLKVFQLCLRLSLFLAVICFMSGLWSLNYC